MSAKQDRQGVRTAKDLEQKYNFGQSFSEVQKSIKVATNTAEQAEKVARNAHTEILQLSNSITLEVDNGESTAAIKMKVGDRELEPATIDMKGLVTFSNLANADGTTVINGSNIKTGQILADFIKAGILASNDGSVRFDLNNNIIEFIGDPWSTAPEGTRSRCVLKNDAGGFSLWSQSAGGVLGLSISATNTGASIGIWKDEAGVAGMRLLNNGKGGIYASQVSVWDAPTVSTDAVNKQYVDSNFAPTGYVSKRYTVTTEADIDNALSAEVATMDSDIVRFIVFTPSTSNLLNGCGTLCELYCRSDSGYATARFINYYLYSPQIYYKTMWAGTWQPFECENPLMIPGVEYRTTEQWNGKPVYVQAVNLNALPSNSLRFVYPTTFIPATAKLVDLFGVVHYSYGNMKPISKESSLDIAINIGDGGWRLDLTSTEDLSAHTGIVTLKYYKE